MVADKTDRHDEDFPKILSLKELEIESLTFGKFYELLKEYKWCHIGFDVLEYYTWLPESDKTHTNNMLLFRLCVEMMWAIHKHEFRYYEKIRDFLSLMTHLCSRLDPTVFTSEIYWGKALWQLR